MQSSRQIELGLIPRCQRGEADAFDDLYGRFGDAVWRLCYRMAGTIADAEDLAQDVWVTVWEQIGSFRCEAAFHTWLYRVASNVCLQWLRKRTHTPTCSLEESCRASSSTPEAEVVRREGVKRLLPALAALPDSLRLPLVLRAGEGLSYSEIAEILDCTTAAAKMRISRARAALAEAMKEEEA